jgi:hypothetical protein
MVGSPVTPYIWDDRCSAWDASEAIMQMYSMSPEERKERGKKGLEWALSPEAGFTAKVMGERIIEACDTLFHTWSPKPKCEIIKIEKTKPNYINHSLTY